MVAKNKTRTKSRGTKASATKLANKRTTKLARQGKLKKTPKKLKSHQQPPNEEKASSTNGHEESPAEEDLNEEDAEFFVSTESDISFLVNAELEDGKSSRRNRKRAVVTDPSTAFEDVPRKRRFHDDDKEQRHLLPIKSGKKVIAQSVDMEEEPDEDGEAEPEDEETPEHVAEVVPELPALSTVELYASRQQKLAERKMQIANAATSLLEDPQENIAHLRDLRRCLEENDPEIYITVRKYAMLSLMEVFKDIIPDYRIRVATEKEKEQAQKKETKALREFEENLLHYYKLYLQYLETMLKGTKSASGKIAGAFIPERARKTFRELAIHCMCILLTSHPDFNFRSNLITTMMPFIVHVNPQISDTICECVKTVFRNDREGQISLEIVLQISKLLKSRDHDVDRKVVATFLALKIKEVDFKREKTENKMSRKEKFLKLSRRERKRAKKMTNLNKELEEAAATVDKNKKLQLHTRIVEIVFMIYFRVLKTVHQSGLLSAVLEGLAKFAHLINIDFFNDLFNVINELVESEELSLRDRLHCMKASFTILTGQGSALTIDPLNFYTHLYKIIYKLEQPEDVKLLLECLDMMMLKRRKQVTTQRALAYIKRLSTHCLQMEPQSAVGLMASIRLTLQAYVKSDLLYDMEGQGSGIYLPELDQPEYCYAQNTQLWEYHLLKRHYHPTVRQYADHMSRGAPTSGQQQLPANLRKEALVLFAETAPKDKLFHPAVRQPPKQKKKSYRGATLLCAKLRAEDERLENHALNEDDLKLLTNHLFKKR